MGSEENKVWDYARKTLRFKRSIIREAIAEFMGTAILLIFVVGSSIQFLLMSARGTETIVMPILGTIFGLFTSIVITGGVTGAHINPAVSLGLAVVGKFSWAKLPIYWICQYSGAYFGAAVAYFIYETKLINLSGGEYPYKAINPSYFSVVPTDISLWTGILDQSVTTGILMMSVLGITDRRNMRIDISNLPLYVAFTVAGINLSFNENAGCLLNPARDLGPRLFALTVGYSYKEVLQSTTLDGDVVEWWLVGLIGPMIGAVLGAGIYLFFIGAQLDEIEESENRRRLKFNDVSYEQSGHSNPAFVKGVMYLDTRDVE